MRLDKFLSKTGYGTRSEVKKLIKSGSVAVNGVAAGKADSRVDENADEVAVNGVAVKYSEYIYLMLNKPQGCVSATDDSRFPTVVDYVPEEFLHYEVYPVGRLDIDTEGLLILTNDGALTHRLLAPGKHVPKTYYAELDTPVGAAAVEMFGGGVEIGDGYKALPAELRILDESGTKAEVVVYEGKFHQVKRMFKACGSNVTFLKRIKMNCLELDAELKPGEIRELTAEELELLSAEKDGGK